MKSDSGTRRPISDWIGALAFGAIAASIWLRSTAFGVLLLPIILHELLTAACFLLRGPAWKTLTGVTPKVITYAHTFVLLGFINIALTWRPEWLRPTPSPVFLAEGGLLWLTGTLCAIWAHWILRYSFSLEPEARDLVLRGPYSVVRHPIYSAYILLYGGMWLRSPTPMFACALVVWLVLLRLRIRNEERVLAGAFPEYALYRAQVGTIFPRLWRRDPAPG